MCGIAGEIRWKGLSPDQQQAIYHMTAALTHRGPDHGGTWVNEIVALGHRRLSIIDTSADGNQPMANEDETVWLVFNGEIYNFSELRNQLQAKGHVFRSGSDSEVILHLYEETGPDLCRHLSGMFAFGLWDTAKQRILLARDRLGKKPLFYAQDAKGLLFASELRSLQIHPEAPSSIDPIALDDYLAFGCVPSPRTIFDGISKLPPGHVLMADSRGTKIGPYWSATFHPKSVANRTTTIAELEDLLLDSVERRLVSDVPLGILLSGGVDSSLVLALAAACTDEKLVTFSVGFNEREFNELGYAREVAKHFRTDHHEIVMTPNVTDLLPDLATAFGEPFADSSALPTLQLCRWVRQHVTVALGGDGGDESFAGYERHLAMARFGQIPDRAGPLFERLGALISPWGMKRGQKSLPFQAARLLKTAQLDPLSKYLSWISIFDTASRKRLYRNPTIVDHSRVAGPLLAAFQNGASLDAILQADLTTYLPNDLLVKTDIASMSASLEVRSPLLDHRIVEFAARLPERMKLRGYTKKALLKEILRKHLPRRLVDRKKMGFAVPIAQWIRGELREVVYDTLLAPSARINDIFRTTEVERLVRNHLIGKELNHPKIWSLLMLETWLKNQQSETQLLPFDRHPRRSPQSR